MDQLTTSSLIHQVAYNILLFGGAILVLALIVILIVLGRTILKVNSLISNFNTMFVQFREGMEKLLDPLLMFVNMLRLSLAEEKGSSKNKQTKKNDDKES